MRITNRKGKLQPNIWERFLSGHNAAENVFTKKHPQNQPPETDQYACAGNFCLYWLMTRTDAFCGLDKLRL